MLIGTYLKNFHGEDFDPLTFGIIEEYYRKIFQTQVLLSDRMKVSKVGPPCEGVAPGPFGFSTFIRSLGLGVIGFIID